MKFSKGEGEEEEDEYDRVRRGASLIPAIIGGFVGFTMQNFLTSEYLESMLRSKAKETDLRLGRLTNRLSLVDQNLLVHQDNLLKVKEELKLDAFVESFASMKAIINILFVYLLTQVQYFSSFFNGERAYSLILTQGEMRLSIGKIFGGLRMDLLRFQIQFIQQWM